MHLSIPDSISHTRTASWCVHVSDSSVHCSNNQLRINFIQTVIQNSVNDFFFPPLSCAFIWNPHSKLCLKHSLTLYTQHDFVKTFPVGKQAYQHAPACQGSSDALGGIGVSACCAPSRSPLKSETNTLQYTSAFLLDQIPQTECDILVQFQQGNLIRITRGQFKRESADHLLLACIY